MVEVEGEMKRIEEGVIWIAEEESPPSGWLDAFKGLKDPRKEKRSWHPLMTVLGIALLAVLSGANHWEEIEVYGKSKQKWLRGFLNLEFGIPSHDTIERVFEHLDAEALEAGFRQWVQDLLEKMGETVKLVALDGKTQKGSYDCATSTRALHQVSAWSSEHRLVLTQLPVDKKSNEITAIPKLLQMLALKGCIVTIDAMGTQKEIAKQIRAKEADYVLSLKGNHPKLHQRVQDWVTAAQQKQWQGIKADFLETQETAHEREETRQVWAIPINELQGWPELEDWSDLQTLAVVYRQRVLWNKTTSQWSFYLSSCPADATVISKAIRSHWGIENQLHWVLDVIFAEDASRIRKGNRPRNFSLLRRLALNILSRETSFKKSLNLKRYRASMDNDYLCLVLSSALNPCLS